jgi:hypothetical protein
MGGKCDQAHAVFRAAPDEFAYDPLDGIKATLPLPPNLEIFSQHAPGNIKGQQDIDPLAESLALLQDPLRSA